MRAARLPFEPRQFEFWFAYKNGRNAALNAAANEIKGRNGALTGPDIDRLHEIYLSPWRMAEKPDAVAARMSARLAELAATLESAIGTAQAQRETFAAETSELAVTTALTLHDVLGAIDRLVAVHAGKPGALRAARSARRYGRARDRRVARAARRRARGLRRRSGDRASRPRGVRRDARQGARRGRRDAPADGGRAVRSRLLHGVQRELRQPRRRSGAALDRHDVQGAPAQGRHGGAFRERSVRRDPAAHAREGSGRLRGTLPPGADDARADAASERRRPHHGLARRRRRDQGRYAGLPAAPRRQRAEGRQARGPQPRGGDDARRAGLGSGAAQPNWSARSCRCRPAGRRRGRPCRARDTAWPPAARPRPT